MSSSWPPDLAGRRAVVTGAAQGIGRAIARRLIDAGTSVVVVDRAAEQLEASFRGERCRIIDGDIRQGAALADRVLDLVGGAVELIVNNVGIATEDGFLDIKESVFDDVYNTNVRGPFFFTQRLVNELLLQRPTPIGAGHRVEPAGSILFLSSVHEFNPSLRPHYDMTKAAIGALVRNLAVSLGQEGIRVNALSPGWIRTNPHPDSEEQVKKQRELSRSIPLGRAGTPDEVARTALHVLSDVTAGYITGATVEIHGGLAPGTWMRPPSES